VTSSLDVVNFTGVVGSTYSAAYRPDSDQISRQEDQPQSDNYRAQKGYLPATSMFSVGPFTTRTIC